MATTRSSPLCETTHQRHAKASTCYHTRLAASRFCGQMTLNTFEQFLSHPETFLKQEFGNGKCVFGKFVAFHFGLHGFSPRSSVESEEEPACKGFKFVWIPKPVKMLSKNGKCEAAQNTRSSISGYVGFHPLTSFPPRIDKSYFLGL